MVDLVLIRFEFLGICNEILMSLENVCWVQGITNWCIRRCVIDTRSWIVLLHLLLLVHWSPSALIILRILLNCWYARSPMIWSTSCSLRSCDISLQEVFPCRSTRCWNRVLSRSFFCYDCFLHCNLFNIRVYFDSRL